MQQECLKRSSWGWRTIFLGTSARKISGFFFECSDSFWDASNCNTRSAATKPLPGAALHENATPRALPPGRVDDEESPGNTPAGGAVNLALRIALRSVALILERIVAKKCNDPRFCTSARLVSIVLPSMEGFCVHFQLLGTFFRCKF